MKKSILIQLLLSLSLFHSYGQISIGDSLELAFGLELENKLIIDLPDVNTLEGLNRYIVKPSERTKSAENWKNYYAFYKNAITLKAGRASDKYKSLFGQNHFYWLLGKSFEYSGKFNTPNDLEIAIEKRLTEGIWGDTIKVVLFIDKDVVVENLDKPIREIKKHKAISKIYVAVRIKETEEKFDIAMKEINPRIFQFYPYQYMDNWVQGGFRLDTTEMPLPNIDYDPVLLKPNLPIDEFLKN